MSVSAKRQITRADILDMSEYRGIRADRRRDGAALKARRRLAVGPVATFHFESYDTIWLQIHEMLFIERGGEAQIPDELAAYGPLVPKGRELVATVMFGIDDPVRRAAVLGALGGVEATMSLQFAGQAVIGQPEGDIERTNDEGKTSSVHFIHFPFTSAQIELFRQPGVQVLAGIGHPNYGHLAILPEAMRLALAADFD